MNSKSLAISTAWNALRHKSGKKMVRELLRLGFDRLELNVHVTGDFLRDIEPMVRKGEVSISSLHNYCPAPDGVKREELSWNVPLLSSTDEAERRSAVLLTKRTIGWAAKLGAPAVVLHLGMAPIEFRQREVTRLLDVGFIEPARELIAQDLAERKKLCGPHLESVIASLRELSGYAESAGVMLGLENRYFLAEIPSLEEIGVIFDAVSSPALGYWHDTGHAHVMRFLGVAGQEEYLSRYGNRLIGMHLHDAVRASDHRAVGRGEIDFQPVITRVRPDTELVLEIHGSSTEMDVVRSREKVYGFLAEIERGKQE